MFMSWPEQDKLDDACDEDQLVSTEHWLHLAMVEVVVVAARIAPQVAQMQWHVAHAAKQELKALVEDARSSSIELPASLTEEERCLLHKFCHRLDLSSKSLGEGE